MLGTNDIVYHSLVYVKGKIKYIIFKRDQEKYCLPTKFRVGFLHWGLKNNLSFDIIKLRHKPTKTNGRNMKNKIIALLLTLIFTLSLCACSLGGGGGALSCAAGHTEENDDGLCDVCDKDLIVTVDFYSINDLHGKFLDTDSQPGVDELTSFLKLTRFTDQHTVLLSTGDMWQGSSESNMTKGQIVTDWMNELDFVSMTLGNHEFDWGEEYIRSNLEAADFPFLAINIYDEDTDLPVDYCDGSVMIERGGIKIGIIGAIGDCYSSISSDKVDGIYFKTGRELTELVEAEADRLLAEGADLLIYALHDGYDRGASGYVATSKLSYYSPSLSFDCIDAVFEGHTHKSYSFYDTGDVYHLQGGGENSAISHLEIQINSISKSKKVTVSEIIPSDIYSDYSSDPAIKEIEKKYEEEINASRRMLGFNSKYRSGNELSEIVAKLYLDFGMELWGSEYDIVLGGGFIKPRSPYNLSRGDVTYSDISMIFPFDNTLMLCSVSGRNLINKFLDTYSDDYYCALSSYGEKIEDLINTGATYYIVVDSYTATYAPNGLTIIREYGEEYFARDMLAKYIEDGGLEH